MANCVTENYENKIRETNESPRIFLCYRKVLIYADSACFFTCAKAFATGGILMTIKVMTASGTR